MNRRRPAGTGEEPHCLQRGKAFHRQVQGEWTAEAEGEVCPEHAVVRPGGRRGRVDVLVDPDSQMVAVVEIKASDWDRMSLPSIRRNVRRQAKQVWSYIESQLERGKDVSPGIVFPSRPRVRGRLEMVEQLYEEEGIPVVWQDETIEERKRRSKGA